MLGDIASVIIVVLVVVDERFHNVLHYGFSGHPFMPRKSLTNFFLGNIIVEQGVGHALNNLLICLVQHRKTGDYWNKK